MGKVVKVHQFHPNIYPRYIWIAKGGTPTFIKEHFRDADCDELIKVEEAFKNAKVAVWDATYGDDHKLGVLIWLLEGVDIGVVAHEAIHAANRIFKACNISYGYYDDEHFAYLAGWIADCIWQTWTGKFKD